MSITEIKVSVGLTINTGNYSSAKVEAGITASLKPEDDLSACFQICWDYCKKEVKKQKLLVSEYK